MKNISYIQKTGKVVSELAMDLLSVDVGAKILPITAYEELLGVSRGTIQNAFAALFEAEAIRVSRKGKSGRYLESKDVLKLQKFCFEQELLGIMPLPYSSTYKALATSFYETFSSLLFNMVYTRGSIGRIDFVERGIVHFAVVSKYSAMESIRAGKSIECIMEFGEGSYLERHALLLRDPKAKSIEEGMRVAIDPESLDQENLTREAVAGREVEWVQTKSQNIVAELLAGRVDAGIWSMDDMLENRRDTGIQVLPLPENVVQTPHRSAAVVIQKDRNALKRWLLSLINRSRFLQIYEEVRLGKKESRY